MVVRLLIDLDFDLRVALREDSELGLEEGVHAFRGPGPVAVSERDAFAREDEGADAILRGSVGGLLRAHHTAAAAEEIETHLGCGDLLNCRQRHVGR